MQEFIAKHRTEASPQTHKEARAREIAVQDGVRQGLIGVLTSVELCRSFEIHRDEEGKRLHRVPRWRKCLFLYHSGIDPGWGFRHARLPTWFHFPIQVCWKGREGLAQQMTAAALDFVRQDNCFPWVEDGVRAQPLLEAGLRVNWASLRDEVAQPLRKLAFSIREFCNADRKSTRLNSSHSGESRMPSSA